MSRIGLEDNLISMVAKMSEGNPGAATAIMEILENHDKIDPQGALGGVGAIMILDTFGIYGTNIYVLWSDKCNRDTRKMLMLLRAVQLGFMPESRLVEISNDQSRQDNLTDEEFNRYDEMVCKQLDQFARPTSEAVG